MEHSVIGELCRMGGEVCGVVRNEGQFLIVASITSGLQCSDLGEAVFDNGRILLRISPPADRCRNSVAAVSLPSRICFASSSVIAWMAVTKMRRHRTSLSPQPGSCAAQHHLPAPRPTALRASCTRCRFSEECQGVRVETIGRTQRCRHGLAARRRASRKPSAISPSLRPSARVPERPSFG